MIQQRIRDLSSNNSTVDYLPLFTDNREGIGFSLHQSLECDKLNVVMNSNLQHYYSDSMAGFVTTLSHCVGIEHARLGKENLLCGKGIDMQCRAFRSSVLDIFRFMLTDDLVQCDFRGNEICESKFPKYYINGQPAPVEIDILRATVASFFLEQPLPRLLLCEPLMWHAFSDTPLWNNILQCWIELSEDSGLLTRSRILYKV